MPISVNCECGARLEIDEKFLGKEVLCPDCQRPLPTKAPAAPPPLDLPNYRRTSGLAVLSLALSLVGAFVGGGLVGIAVGFLALKEIAAHSGKLDGVNLARAGIAAGFVGTFILLVSLISPTVFGLDVYLRDLAMGSRLEYSIREIIEAQNDKGGLEIKRPSRAWARYISSSFQPNVTADDLILVNTVEDAYIACQNVFVEFDDDKEARQKKALDRFNKSQLVDLVGRLRGAPHDDATVVETTEQNGDVHEILVDIRLGGIERRAILRFSAKEQNRITVLVGCARKSRFERAEKEFRDTFATFKNKL